MNKTLVRFGVSLPSQLSERFDKLIRQKKYSSRSEAIRDLIRRTLIQEDIDQDEEIIGVLHLLYDHHRRELTEHLTEIQHNQHQLIISANHVHLDHKNCLEVILLKGKAGQIKELADSMIACKGVKDGQLYRTSRGHNLA